MPRRLLLLPLALAACDKAPPSAAPAPSPAAPAPVAATPEAAPADGPPAIPGLATRGSANQYDIDLPTDILFDFDEADLRPAAIPMLQRIDAHLDAAGADQLHVRGYTDAKGDDQYNFRLSMRRAAAVCEWLKSAGQRTANCIGRGEQDPVAPNARADGTDDPDGRQRNRRVTLSVVRYPDVNAMLDQARRRAAQRPE